MTYDEIKQIRKTLIRNLKTAYPTNNVNTRKKQATALLSWYLIEHLNHVKRDSVSVENLQEAVKTEKADAILSILEIITANPKMFDPSIGNALTYWLRCDKNFTFKLDNTIKKSASGKTYIILRDLDTNELMGISVACVTKAINKIHSTLKKLDQQKQIYAELYRIFEKTEAERRSHHPE